MWQRPSMGVGASKTCRLWQGRQPCQADDGTAAEGVVDVIIGRDAWQRTLVDEAEAIDTPAGRSPAFHSQRSVSAHALNPG